MKIGFIGCVESSKMALEALLSIKNNVEIVGVITKNVSNFNSDHVDLAELCIENNIPYHYEIASAKDDSLNFMKSLKPDVIYCFGWSYLLNNEFLNLTPKGVIGFHPAALPLNRGRHPIIWAIALGLESTASTFFKMDLGADTGPILSQEKIDIKEHDDANILYDKILVTANKQIIEFTQALACGEESYLEQDNSIATTWRKRSRNDGLIDWRMGAEDIHNLIKALTKPYPGAEFRLGDELIQVWASTLCGITYPRNIEPGRILAIEKQGLLVKCAGVNAIWLNDIVLAKQVTVGSYL